MTEKKQETKSAISPTRQEDYAEWYQQIVKASDLAEHSPVRGCMVIKPWGYALWENMQKVLDKGIKATGHKNVYFPLFIPLSYFEKEAAHVEGFAKECAVITHHRLENKNGKLVPAGELEEPLIVRPTSEMIIGEAFSRWIESYRDLPVLINQWANIVRWEMRTRLFLRTMEFLWQEGHTAHATRKEAEEETLKMLDLYVDFMRNTLAIPVVKGEKSELERFPGAIATYSFEAMMQDRKALQAGTSHFLGQNFAKACNIQFSSQEGSLEHVWTTSWGVTTRLIGALIMTHSDDNGLILPPKIVPYHIVLLPILHIEEKKEAVLQYVQTLKTALEEKDFHGRKIEVFVDKRDKRGGEKKWEWIKKGTPILIEIGPRDIDQDLLCVEKRTALKEIKKISKDLFLQTIVSTLDEMQKELLEKAEKFQALHTKEINSKEEFIRFFTPQNPEKPEIHGGFAMVHWAGSSKDEEHIKTEYGVTLRCIPLEGKQEKGICPFTGKESHKRVLFAKAY